MVLEPKKRDGIIMNLMKQDFEMINLFAQLDAVGFSNINFPSITYQVFDLIGIPEALRSDDLFNQYDQWAEESKQMSNDSREREHLQVVYEDLRKLSEFSYV